MGTNIGNIYAIGDVNAKMGLAHVASALGRDCLASSNRGQGPMPQKTTEMDYMCLGVPMRIVEIDGFTARYQAGADGFRIGPEGPPPGFQGLPVFPSRSAEI